MGAAWVVLGRLGGVFVSLLDRLGGVLCATWGGVLGASRERLDAALKRLWGSLWASWRRLKIELPATWAEVDAFQRG